MATLKNKAIVEKIRLVDGKFSPSQANDIIKSLIDTKINYHKLNRLSITEGNHNDNTPYENEMLNKLETEKEKLINIIKEAQIQNKNLKISSLINIEY